MSITNTDLQRALGRKYDPKALYSIHDNQGGLAKVCAGTHQAVGKLPTNSDGEMIILQLTEPKRTLLDKLRGSNK